MKQKICWSAEADASFREYVRYLRSQPPRRGFPRKTFSQLCEEQGIKPIDKNRLREIAVRFGLAEDGS